VSDLHGLALFAQERERIRLAREHGLPAPWTDDPILQKYRFCNVRRRDDRVSRWLLQNAYPHLDPEGDAWFVAAAMRLINWPPTLGYLLAQGVVTEDADQFSPDEFAQVLKDYQVTHAKAYTGAYILYAGGRRPQFKGVSKADFIAKTLLLDLASRRFAIRQAVETQSVEATVLTLQGSFGVSSFMAGQIAADLSYLPWLEKARDLHSWAPRGPGSMRGLNRLHGRLLNEEWGQEAFNEELMRVNRAIVLDVRLTLHDVQNVLCEWDKYERVRLGQGVPRSQYRPETAY